MFVNIPALRAGLRQDDFRAAEIDGRESFLVDTQSFMMEFRAERWGRCPWRVVKYQLPQGILH
jgi:hypothetical protein